MTRPLALIEGDLTIPLPRPYDGLPPPFGFHRNTVHEARQRAVRQPAAPRAAGSFPPGVKHILFYKVLPQRVDASRYDGALAEAKSYLEMGTVRPRSTRSDHLLAASIFAGCTMALTWLLVTCSMKDAEKTKAVQVALATATAATGHVQPLTQVDKTAIADTRKVVPINDAMPKHAVQIVPKQTVQLTARDGNADTASTTKPPKRFKMARLSGAHVSERLARSRATHPVARPAVSTQPDWSTSASHSHEIASTDDAPWLNWSIPQRHPATQAATPLDNSWNVHMTQRRITDDPGAFHTDHGAQ
jgi:hypothetical protein